MKACREFRYIVNESEWLSGYSDYGRHANSTNVSLIPLELDAVFTSTIRCSNIQTISFVQRKRKSLVRGHGMRSVSTRKQEQEQKHIESNLSKYLLNAMKKEIQLMV